MLLEGGKGSCTIVLVFRKVGRNSILGLEWPKKAIKDRKKTKGGKKNDDKCCKDMSRAVGNPGNPPKKFPDRDTQKRKGVNSIIRKQLLNYLTFFNSSGAPFQIERCHTQNFHFC